MKLVATSSLALLVKLVASENKYSSTCTDDGFLEIKIPYNNELTSNLLSVVAEDCNESGPSSDNHEYSFDKDAEQATLKLNIEKCGLDTIYTESKLRSGNQYYMAAANVTLGVRDEENNKDLIFYNAYLGAECGEKVDYTVKFDYSQKIDRHDPLDCHAKTPEGKCIVAAFDSYKFVINEYINDEYIEKPDTDVVHQANKMIYLQIEATDLPAHKKFAVKKCTFVDTHKDEDGNEKVERYPMFDAEKGSCSNRYIDLKFGYDRTSMDAQIEHRLFLLEQGDQDSYSLECDLKVCDKDDLDSDCNKWGDLDCLEFSDAEEYMCSGAGVKGSSGACPGPEMSCSYVSQANNVVCKEHLP